LRVTDNIVGAAAGAVLIIGMLRVVYFEKGPGYYWHDLFFIAKFSAFIIAALISIYPTVIFLSWGKSLKAGVVPDIPAPRTRAIRLCLMLELTAIVVILLCAALMARGFGYLR
jgi:putative membrane protein